MRLCKATCPVLRANKEAMKAYVNRNPTAVIQAVSFAPVANGNYAFITLADQARADAVRQQLAAPNLGQRLLAETQVDGKTVLVTMGDKPVDSVLLALKAQGDALRVAPQTHRVDPWVIRSMLGIGGQALQLASSFMRPAKKNVRFSDPSISVFASANLAANAINLVYKAQTLDDPHRLRYLKEQVNGMLAPELDAGQQSVDVNDDRQKERGDPQRKPIHSSFNGFMQRYSVNIGELGLRYLGAFGLVAPVDNWRSSLKNRTLPPLEKSPFRRAAGLGSLAGKSVALLSTVPDPYNPRETSSWQHFRSDMSFKLGGAVEAGAFAALAYDCIARTGPGKAQPDRGIMLNGVHRRDWLGGIGASMFVVGYITRIFAKYGTRHVDMPELYAHTSDMLAKLPADKLPQALADTAARLTEYLKDEPSVDYATIYAGLVGDLGKFHAPVIEAQPTLLAAFGKPGAQVSEAYGVGRLEAGKEPVSRRVG